jgi:hypothetical protein
VHPYYLPLFLIAIPVIWLNIRICQTLGFSILKKSPLYLDSKESVVPHGDRMAWVDPTWGSSPSSPPCCHTTESPSSFRIFIKNISALGCINFMRPPLRLRVIFFI